MGRVLLAALGPAELDAFLDTATLTPITRRTVTDPCRLRQILDETRRRGWALVDQELEDGVRSIAAPVRDGSARPVAALNCSAHAGRVTLERLVAEFVPRLLDAAERVSAALGAR